MVEIIPKKEKKEISLESIFFLISILFFLFSLSLFLYFSYLIKNTEEKIADTSQQIFNLWTPETRELEKEVLKWRDKISHFNNIINQYLKSSKFFPYLEEKTHKKVYFTKIDLDLEKLKCQLEGQTESFYTLAQQFEIFKNSFPNAKLENISFSNEGRVTFRVLLDIPKELLQ